MEGRRFECLVAREIINVCRNLKMTLKKTEEKECVCFFWGGGGVCCSVWGVCVCVCVCVSTERKDTKNRETENPINETTLSRVSNK